MSLPPPSADLPRGVPRTLEWIGDLNGHVRMIDQTRLPDTLCWHECHDSAAVWEAIKVLRVRGAPAIGVAAAMGLVLGVRNSMADETTFFAELQRQQDYLAGARPTAVNLAWALQRLVDEADAQRGRGPAAIAQHLLDTARHMRDADADSCAAIGRHGAEFIPDGGRVLTHCNAGSLATAERGTALAVMYAAHDAGKSFTVYADETRPLLQGARLTAWELSQAGIDVVAICDSMAAHVLRDQAISCVITGADRIAANGDTANKIGTYGLALLAHAHGVPFYVAAPLSTLDLACPDGAAIPIEQRDPDEIRYCGERQTVPDEARVYNPAFDVTPAGLVTALITDHGVIRPVNQAAIATHVAEAGA